MEYKYRVEILDVCGEVEESWDYKTKKDISISYNIPVYVVNKLIEDPDCSRKMHQYYKELLSSMRITINRPNITY